MSQVYMAHVVIAGDAQAIRRFDEALEKADATAEAESFERNVLAQDAEGQAVAAHYRATTSRSQPAIWHAASFAEVARLQAVVLSLLYEEQGCGSVFVELGEKPLFQNQDIYGFSPEGQDQVRLAQRCFTKIAEAQFGLDVVLDLTGDTKAPSDNTD